MIILNTPHNPLGKVFTSEELQLIANLCQKHNVLCLSDEVYEWMAFEPVKHIRIGKSLVATFFYLMEYHILWKS